MFDFIACLYWMPCFLGNWVNRISKMGRTPLIDRRDAVISSLLSHKKRKLPKQVSIDAFVRQLREYHIFRFSDTKWRFSPSKRKQS